MVVGDATSRVAFSLVVVKAGVQAAPIEAGLGSFDRATPEEINHMVTDRTSDRLIATEQSGLGNLKAEGASDRQGCGSAGESPLRAVLTGGGVHGFRPAQTVRHIPFYRYSFDDRPQ